MPLYFTQSIRHGRDCLHLAPVPPLLRPPPPLRLFIGTYNILYGRGFGIDQDIRAVQVGGFDLMVLTETKANGQAY